MVYPCQFHPVKGSHDGRTTQLGRNLCILTNLLTYKLISMFRCSEDHVNPLKWFTRCSDCQIGSKRGISICGDSLVSTGKSDSLYVRFSGSLRDVSRLLLTVYPASRPASLASWRTGIGAYERQRLLSSDLINQPIGFCAVGTRGSAYLPLVSERQQKISRKPRNNSKG